MRIIIALISIFAVLEFSSMQRAYAECVCTCVNGQQKAVCSNALDIQPICPPRICPIVPPSIPPIQAPTIPPIGTTDCEMKQVYNEYARKYEWKQICARR